MKLLAPVSGALLALGCGVAANHNYGINHHAARGSAEMIQVQDAPLVVREQIVEQDVPVVESVSVEEASVEVASVEDVQIEHRIEYINGHAYVIERRIDFYDDGTPNITESVLEEVAPPPPVEETSVEVAESVEVTEDISFSDILSEDISVEEAPVEEVPEYVLEQTVAVEDVPLEYEDVYPPQKLTESFYYRGPVQYTDTTYSNGVIIRTRVFTNRFGFRRVQEWEIASLSEPLAEDLETPEVPEEVIPEVPDILPEEPLVKVVQPARRWTNPFLGRDINYEPFAWMRNMFNREGAKIAEREGVPRPSYADLEGRDLNEPSALSSEAQIEAAKRAAVPWYHRQNENMLPGPFLNAIGQPVPIEDLVRFDAALYPHVRPSYAAENFDWVRKEYAKKPMAMRQALDVNPVGYGRTPAYDTFAWMRARLDNEAEIPTAQHVKPSYAAANFDWANGDR